MHLLNKLTELLWFYSCLVWLGSWKSRLQRDNILKVALNYHHFFKWQKCVHFITTTFHYYLCFVPGASMRIKRKRTFDQPDTEFNALSEQMLVA